MGSESFTLFHMVFGAFYNVALYGESMAVKKGHQVSCPNVLCLIPLRRGFSLTLKLGWQPVSTSDPPASVHCSAGIAGTCYPTSRRVWEFELRSWVFTEIENFLNLKFYKETQNLIPKQSWMKKKIKNCCYHQDGHVHITNPINPGAWKVFPFFG